MSQRMALARAKKLLTPVALIILLVVLSFFSNWPFPWLAYTPPDCGASSCPRWLSWGAFGGAVFGLIFLAELLTYLLVGRLHIDPARQSFVSAVLQRDYYGVFVQYPAVLLLEEIFFRGILLVFLAEYMPFLAAVGLSSVLFGAYHLHIFLSSRQWPITCAYIAYSFFLGAVIASFFPLYGVIGAWAAHLAVVTYVYLRWLMKLLAGVGSVQKE